MKLPSRTISTLALGLLLAPMAHASSCQSLTLPNGITMDNESSIRGPYGAVVSTQGCAVSSYNDTFANGYSFQAAAQASSVAVHASASTSLNGLLNGPTPTITATAASVLPFTVHRLASATATHVLLGFNAVGDGRYGTASNPDTLAGFFSTMGASYATGTSPSFHGTFHDSHGTNPNWNGQHNITGPTMDFDYSSMLNAYFDPGANWFTMQLNVNVRGVGFADLYNTSKLVDITVYTPGFALSFTDNAFVPDPQQAGHYLLNLPTVAPSVPEPETWALMLAGLACVGALVRQGRGTQPPFVPHSASRIASACRPA
jgi:hypothetical protein